MEDALLHSASAPEALGRKRTIVWRINVSRFSSNHQESQGFGGERQTVVRRLAQHHAICVYPS